MHPKTPRRLALVSKAQEAPSLENAASLEDELLQVGELAKQTGKTVRAIHLYEDMGILRPVDRSKGRYRLFNADSVERVRWISKLQTLGFSLPEIQAILRGHEDVATAKEAAQRLRAVYVEKLKEVQQRLSELHCLEHELMSSLAYLDACQHNCDGRAPVHSCPSCERHQEQEPAPGLVAGAFTQ